MKNNDKDLIDEAFSEMESLKTAVEQLQKDIAELKKFLFSSYTQSKKPVAGSQQTVAGSQRGQKTSTSLPEYWQYPTITQEIVDAVVSSTGVKAAAAKLDMPEKSLSRLLKESGVPHLYGEKWAFALKRAISGEEAVDTFTYPKKWIEKKEKVKKYYNNNGLIETRQFLSNSEMSPSLSQVGRFLQRYCEDL